MTTHARLCPSCHAPTLPSDTAEFCPQCLVLLYEQASFTGTGTLAPDAKWKDEYSLPMAVVKEGDPFVQIAKPPVTLLPYDCDILTDEQIDDYNKATAEIDAQQASYWKDRPFPDLFPPDAAPSDTDGGDDEQT